MTPEMQSSGVRYSGTKTLTAWPMTRGQYNSYRTWTPPDGEDQTAAGYLVEYSDGGAANDSRHVGYISWSPAEVFERSYRPIGTFQDRVRFERDELADKRAKLAAFIGDDSKLIGVTPDQLGLLIRQHEHMAGYLDVLDERIAAFEPEAVTA